MEDMMYTDYFAAIDKKCENFPSFVTNKDGWEFPEDWSEEPSFLETSIVVASLAHAGQRDKQGRPHILHCLRVMMQGKTDEERAVGVLHDILEDTNLTAQDLLADEIPFHIVEAVIALTHDKDSHEPRKDYYERIKSNPLALKVKRYDLNDNTQLHRFSELDENTATRLIKKYKEAYEYLYEEIPEHLNGIN